MRKDMMSRRGGRGLRLGYESLEERRVLDAYMLMGDFGNTTFGNDPTKWLQIESMTSAIERSPTSGAVALGGIEITRKFDSASPKILEACAKGVVFQQATIIVGTNAYSSSTHLRYTLHDVRVTSVTLSSGVVSPGSYYHDPRQLFTVSYARADWAYVRVGYSEIVTSSYNQGPTDISLSSATVPENRTAGTVVGSLATTDPDAGGEFTYSLVAGTGSTDNESFTIVGGELRTATPFDFETKNSYSVRVRSTDQNDLFVDKVFTISVTDVLDLPSAPTGIVASAVGSQIAVSWNAPSSDGGSAVLGYLVHYSNDSGMTWKRLAGLSSTTSVSVPGLPTGVSYVFRVAAVNSLGRGLFSATSNSVTPLAESVTAFAFRSMTVLSVPSAAGVAIGTARDGQISLKWRQPVSDGGSPITGYVVEYRPDVPGAAWIRIETKERAAIVSGLSNGVGYRFRVAARNAVGVGRFGRESAVVTPMAGVA